MTNHYDQREREPRYTICPDCDEDLEWHECSSGPSERTLRLRELNDALRRDPDANLKLVVKRQLVITRGIAALGDDFLNRAMAAVRAYDTFPAEDFSTEDDNEHDFGSFELDGRNVFWKIDYYDTDFERGSPDPTDTAATKRVLTILLAEEY